MVYAYEDAIPMSGFTRRTDFPSATTTASLTRWYRVNCRLARENRDPGKVQPVVDSERNGSKSGKTTGSKKTSGPCPWDNSVVTAACEDKDGNLVVGTLGAGIFWYKPDGKHRHIRRGRRLVVGLHPLLVRGPRGKSLGGNRRRRTGPDQTENFPCSRRTSPVGGAIGFRGYQRWIVGGIRRARRVPIGTQTPSGFSRRPASNRMEMLVDHQQHVWVRHARRRAFYFPGQSVFNPRPARQFSGSRFSRCLKTAPASCGQERKTACRVGTARCWKMFTGARTACLKTSSAPLRKMPRKSLGRHRKRRLEFFQAPENSSLPRQ